jgi:hypothetical protein
MVSKVSWQARLFFGATSVSIAPRIDFIYGGDRSGKALQFMKVFGHYSCKLAGPTKIAMRHRGDTSAILQQRKFAIIVYVV